MIAVSHARHDTLALLAGKPGKKRIVSFPGVALSVFDCLRAQIGVINSVGKQR
jgi:hypothetical protein